MRRAICGLTLKNYNTIFLRLAAVARESGGSLEALRLSFTEFSGSSNLFPSDQDLRQAFAIKPAYENMPRPRWWYIFRELEFASRDEYNEVEGLKPDLEIEHILPQTWYEHWPLPDGSNAPHDLTYGLSDEQRAMVERRKSLIHVLGNLTLLTKPANIEVLKLRIRSGKEGTPSCLTVAAQSGCRGRVVLGRGSHRNASATIGGTGHRSLALTQQSGESRRPSGAHMTSGRN
jgi:Protein of unknown function (DUF1524)